MVFIVRKKLTADDIQPPGTRWNVDCDCIQVTPDHGTTWNDAPGLDPRSAPGYRLPPTPVDDPQCNAAANMVAALRKFVDADIQGASVFSLASSTLAAVLLFIPGIGIIVDAFLIAADIILGLGSLAITDAFTEEVYADLLCAFYCNIGPDGQMTDENLTALTAKIADDFDSVVQAVFGAHSSTMGAVGWSNAGVVGESTDADCSGCDCGPWCYEWNFRTSDGGFLNWSGRGEYVPGEGWKSTVGAGYVAATIGVLCGDGSCDSPIDEFSAVIDYVTLPATGYNAFWYRTGAGDGSYNNIGYGDLDVPVGEATYTYTDPSLYPYPNVGVNAVINDVDGLLYIRSMRVTGTGAMPDFVGGAVC